MGAFEQLLEAWRSNPDADSTLTLCRQLGEAPREELVREVGARAEQWHAADGEVMLGVGRMYLDAGLLAEAQAALVNAGKANPRDGRAFRFLGEVLLRRGDAARAEKVLQRATQLGAADADTKLWHDRSVVYVALQKRVGPQAVAQEVARTLPARAPQPPPMAPVAMPPQTRSPWAEEAPTLRRSAAQAPPLAARPPMPNARPRSVPPPLPPAPVAPVAIPAAARAPSISDDDETTVHQNLPPGGPRDMFPSGTGSTTTRRHVEGPAAPPPGAYQDFGSPAPLPAFGGPAPQSFPGTYGAPPPAPPAPPPPTYGAPPPPAPSPQGYGAPAPQAYVPQSPFAPIPRGPLEEDDSEPVRPEDAANPTPEAVLESLARVGIYEPGGGAPPAWAAAAQKSRGSWVLIVATVLILAVGGGGLFYARKVQKDRQALARRLSDEVEVMLHSGEMAQLKTSDERLSRIFELDSRSPRAAKLWLQNRVLGALILPSEARGIDSAMHRARSVEVPEAEVVFGKLASYLVEGDLAGAAASLPKYDKESGKDPYYQLTAGAVLERAGDARAIERYEAARALDPKLIVADIMLARAVLLELGPPKGKPVIEELKKKTGETPATRALEALAWAVDPDRPKELPKSATVSEEDRKVLIMPLQPVPAVVEAMQAISGGLEKKATGAIDSAISLSDSPAMATELGFLAIKAGDEKLARKAALRALQFSALYPQARVLASRVALLSGRLDEAKKAIEELDPKTPEVAVVRAVLAYETLDGSELGSAIESMGELPQKHPDYVSFATMPSVVTGVGIPAADKLTAMAQPSVPWGELVAVDAALAQGDLALADKITKEWGEGANRAVYALRMSRLARYQDKMDDAEKFSGVAIEQGSTTVSVLVERVWALMAKNQAGPARDLISKYPSLLGPLGGWLRMYVDAKGGRAPEARAKAAQLDPPPEEAPLLLRVTAARALAVTKDRRAKAYVAALQKKLKKHPEVLKAAEELK
ncbi:MAG: hypothetical protein U0263_12760 [Polyangiaceae bacterium]